jgi:sec-independent protein translocase protein TatA
MENSMENPEIWIALIIVGFLIFGAKRMPDAARGLGRSLRIFKAETKGMLTDDEQKAAAAQPLQIPTAAPVYAPAVEQVAAPVYAPPVQPAPVYAPPVQQAAPAPVAPAPVTAPAPVAPVAAPIPAEQPVTEHRDAQ